MSFADWQYPLRNDRPYSILLPDLQSQRQLTGRGMTAWIRLQLSKGETLQKNMDRLARQELSKTLGVSKKDVERMTKEERIMRWFHLLYQQFRSKVEPLASQSPLQVIAEKGTIDAANKQLLAETSAKSSPFPVALPQGILACRNFERRVKFIQTIEAIRDYSSRHDGALPAKLDDLHLPAPNDPFTEQPFVYEMSGRSARLRQAVIEGYSNPVYDYEITVKWRLVRAGAIDRES